MPNPTRLAATVVLIAAASSSAAISQRWLLQIPRFLPSRLIADPAGNAIVVGTQYSASNTTSGIAVYCYSQDQQLLWSWDDGLGGADAAVDAELLPDGSLVIAGQRGARWRIVKLSPGHTQVWATTYIPAGEPIADDAASRVQVDASGNVYVCGYTQGPITQDARVTKFSGATGGVLWSQVRGIQERWDRFEDMALDAAGNVVVVGEVGDSDFDEQLKLAIVSFTPTGAQRWAHYLLGQWTEPDQQGFFEIGTGRAVAVAPSGAIFVGGIFGDDMQFTDLAAIKVSSAGAIQWRRQGNGADDGLYDRAYAIALGRQEQVYLTGESFQNTGFNYFNAPVVAYSSAGTFMWSDAFNSPPGSNDSEDVSMNILVDEFNRVVMVGSDWTKPGPDYFVRRFDPAGQLIDAVSADTPLLQYKINARRTVALAPGGKLFFAASEAGLVPLNGSTATIGLLELPLPQTACPADTNADGTLNADDLADYINCFFAAPGVCPQGDFNTDGDTNGDDLADYINAYFAGC